MTANRLPRVVSQAEWQTALGERRAREKAATRVRDALAAGRPQTPSYGLRQRHDEYETSKGA